MQIKHDQVKEFDRVDIELKLIWSRFSDSDFPISFTSQTKFKGQNAPKT